MAILKEISAVASISMPIGETWTVSRCRYRSDDGAGRRLCLTTGIHGDEMMGQLVVQAFEETDVQGLESKVRELMAIELNRKPIVSD